MKKSTKSDSRLGWKVILFCDIQIAPHFHCNTHPCPETYNLIGQFQFSFTRAKEYQGQRKACRIYYFDREFLLRRLLL